jgi:ketosteroid isomerase-like protein
MVAVSAAAVLAVAGMLAYFVWPHSSSHDGQSSASAPNGPGGGSPGRQYSPNQGGQNLPNSVDQNPVHPGRPCALDPACPHQRTQGEINQGGPDAKEISAVIQAMADAYNKGDVPAYEGQVCSKFQAAIVNMNPTNGAGVFLQWGFKQMWQDALEKTGPVTRTQVSDVRLNGDHAAAEVYVMYHKSETGDTQEQFVKENGRWKMCFAEDSGDQNMLAQSRDCMIYMGLVSLDPTSPMGGDNGKIQNPVCGV